MTAQTRHRIAAPCAALLLAACSHHARPPVATVAALPPPPARPTLNRGLGAVEVPPQTADGGYRTIDRGIGPEQTAWHLRAALNVAAIACRGEDGPALVAAYNAMLTAEAKPLAAADAAVKAEYRARFGTGWQAAHDAYMTRLYNYFALPPAKAALCAAAARIAPQAAAVPPEGFVAFAGPALAQLDGAITGIYRQVDAYRTALARWDVAQWDRRYGAGAGPAAERTLAIRAASSAHTPRLAYADMGAVIAWQPAEALALR